MAELGNILSTHKPLRICGRHTDFDMEEALNKMEAGLFAIDTLIENQHDTTRRGGAEISSFCILTRTGTQKQTEGQADTGKYTEVCAKKNTKNAFNLMGARIIDNTVNLRQNQNKNKGLLRINNNVGFMYGKI